MSIDQLMLPRLLTLLAAVLVISAAKLPSLPDLGFRVGTYECGGRWNETRVYDRRGLLNLLREPRTGLIVVLDASPLDAEPQH